MENKNQDIENRFTYHKPTDDKAKIYPILRDKTKELAYLIESNVPNGREKSCALSKLE